MFKRILIALSLLIFANFSFAEKIQIEADRMKGEKNLIIYEGNVFLHTDKGKKLYCDLLKIYLDKNNKIEKAVAIGHVRYFGPRYSAVSKRATYKPSEDLIILEGNAVIKNNKGILKGDKVVYNLKTGDVEAVATERVFSIFETKDNK
jgi:lipopolysaccharide transport protein LptA